MSKESDFDIKIITEYTEKEMKKARTTKRFKRKHKKILKKKALEKFKLELIEERAREISAIKAYGKWIINEYLKSQN